MKILNTVFFLFIGLLTNLSAQTTFLLSSDTISCGEQTCLQVSVQNFTNVISFQYSMNWDDVVLGNTRIQSFGIADLNDSNFNIASPGIARVGWDDSNTIGITLPDNQMIFEICFDEIGGNTATPNVIFSSNPISIEVVDGQGNIIDALFQDGTVAINCDTMPVPVDTTTAPLPFGVFIATDTVNCGEQICLDVSVQGFTDIVSFQYSLNWDFMILGTATTQQEIFNNIRFSAIAPGSFLSEWRDQSGQGVSLPDNQIIYQTCFDAIGNSTNSTAIEFINAPIPIIISDIQGVIQPNLQNGNVQMNCEPIVVDTTTDIADSLIFALTTAAGICGEQVCLDVSVSDFNELSSFQYSMNWDADALGAATIQNFGLADLNEGNFNTTTPGIIQFGWDDSSLQGVSLPDNHILYQICFDVSEEANGSIEVTFLGTPIIVEVVDLAGNLLTPDFLNGTVNISCDTMTEPVEPIDTTLNIGDNLTFILSETSGDCADQVCMEVSVRNFKDILSFQYSINWDVTLLGTASVQSFGMPDLGNSNFNTNNPGILRMGWDDTFITGVTLPDDQVIYQICFDNISGAMENEVIEFSGIPTSIEVVNDQSNLVVPDFQSGTLNITCDDTNNENADSDLIFILSETTASCGEQICMDVSVKGFRDILTFQYSILWDGSSLGIASVQSFGVPDLSFGNFNNNSSGVLRVGWDDTFITGVTLPDDRIIYQICFDAKEEPLNTTSIQFADTPTSIEVVDRNSMLLSPAFQNGSVTVNCDSVMLVDNDNDGFTSDVDCDDNNPIIFPGAIEFPNNEIDEDCDGIALFIDEDNDGFHSSIDCDDNNPNINPNATEIPNNGIDEDCDGMDLVTEVIDNDNDGFDNDVDCDDNNPAINPDAAEIANNNIDENCDGVVQIIDEDNDGFNSDEDCDDNNPTINPDAAEIANNNIDENCDGVVQIIDADNDGFNSDEDCDDNNPAINPGATEVANNNIDENCDGVVQIIDADNDGFNSDEDCDDNNPAINPGATEVANNGIDEDCDGEDLVTVSNDAATMSFSTETVDCGNQVCFNSSVKNFNDLISFQYSILWDSSILSNVSTQNYNLAGLNASGFFTPNDGVMRVSWFDTNVAGVSVSDDEVIFQICFDIIGTTATSTILQFSNSPIPIEVIDNQSAEVEITTVDGLLNVNCPNTNTIISPPLHDATMHTLSPINPNNLFGNQGAKLKNNNAHQSLTTNKDLENVQLYPNPTTGVLNIVLESSLKKNGIIKIYDVWGKLLKTKTLSASENRHKINLNTLPSGVYLIEIQENTAFFRERVVKQ